MGSPERHIVRHYRLSEALEGKRAKLFSGDASLQCDIDPLAEQNLVVLGLGAQPSCNIAHGADRGVAGAFGEPDLAKSRTSRQRG